MNEVLSVGLILMAALTAGHLAQLIRLPEVTGYLAIGMLIGPSGLDLITHDNLNALGILSEVALGLILFNIGSIFEASVFRQLGPGVMRITFWEASLAFVLVYAIYAGFKRMAPKRSEVPVDVRPVPALRGGPAAR